VRVCFCVSVYLFVYQRLYIYIFIYIYIIYIYTLYHEHVIQFPATPVLSEKLQAGEIPCDGAWAKTLYAAHNHAVSWCMKSNRAYYT
jgi:hypothetical protein